MMKWRCFAGSLDEEEVADEAAGSVSRRIGGSGMERGARRGWRWRKMGTVVTGTLAGGQVSAGANREVVVAENE
jgi:hypothetical protein